MDEQPPSEPRSLTLCPRDLYGLLGVVFLLFLLLGGPLWGGSPASFLAPAVQAESTCPLNLDPENARQSAPAPLNASRTLSAERSHAAFVGVSVTVAAPRAQRVLSQTVFVLADAPPPLLPGYQGLASFALPPPQA